MRVERGDVTTRSPTSRCTGRAASAPANGFTKLIGSWRGHGEEMAGEVRFAIDHTFTEREWDATNSLSDAGDSHVRGDKLVLDFHGDTRPPNARHVEFSMAMHDQNHFTLRQANGVESTFERLK
jgi:hypothetical protein